MPRIFTEEQLGRDRVNGFYETPLKTVEYICNQVLPYYKPGKKVLDPAVGDGVFLYALNKAGVRPSDLYGFDIDETKVKSLQVKFPNVQLFDATNPYPQAYDIIVGNPPYNGDESHYVRAHRKRLKRIFKEIDAKNTYSMITYQCIRALPSGGKLCMILSDSFLTNIYYKKFRLFLLQNTKITELLLAPWKLFHGRSADVRTCIITLTKKDELEAFFNTGKDDNPVRLVDRVHDESEYTQPPRVEQLRQSEFYDYPNTTFLIGVPQQIRRIYLDAERRLGDIVSGGTGISTGNDKKFLRRKEHVAGDKAWVPYFKNGARQAYFYEPEFYIEKDYRQHDEVGNYLVRNQQFFFREGVSCSSVGVRFSAAYMPSGCLFGVNANFFFDDRQTLFYTLGLLNSKLSWYFARKVLIRTNNISANYLRLLPYCEPPAKAKAAIAERVEAVVHRLEKDPAYDYSRLQAELDEQFYKIYGLKPATIAAIERFTSDFYSEL